MERVQSLKDVVKVFTFFQTQTELLRALKSNKAQSECEEQLLELLLTWISLLQTIREGTFRPLTNLKSINDNLKGLLAKCQLVSSGKQPYKYQNFKLQIEMVRKSVLKIEGTIKMWNFSDLENKICALTGQFAKQVEMSQRSLGTKEEEKQVEISTTEYLVQKEQIKIEINDLQTELRKMQEDQSQIQQILEDLQVNQKNLDIQLWSLLGLKGYNTDEIITKFQQQKSEFTSLKLLLANLLEEQTKLEGKIKSELLPDKRTDVVFDFYFITNPEIFEQKKPKRNFVSQFVKSVVDKITNDESNPQIITQFISNIMDHERKQGRLQSRYQLITIENLTPFTYKHSKVDACKFPDQFKFQVVDHKAREDFLQQLYLDHINNFKNTEILAVYIFFLADPNWTRRFQKFCERIKDIEKKLILVIDCEIDKAVHSANKTTYSQLLDQFNKGWISKSGEMTINNSLVLAYSKIDMNNLNVQRALSSYFMQCQGISSKENKDLEALRDVNNDIVRLELQLAQLKFTKRENKHIITIQNNINQGDAANSQRVQEELAVVNYQIIDFKQKHSDMILKSQNVQNFVKQKKSHLRDIQNIISKREFQEKQRSLVQNKFKKQHQIIDFSAMASGLDVTLTILPLKSSFNSFISEVSDTLKDVLASLDKIQKDSENDDAPVQERIQTLKDIETHIENVLMKNFAREFEDITTISQTRI